MAQLKDKDQKENKVISNFNDVTYESLSPMMQQYYDIKKNHREYFLFFRMGDFFEMFFEDAVISSNILGVVLTKKLAGSGQEVSMCGVPVHSYENYLHRLIKHGYNVAICDQLENPEDVKKRGGKSLVNRGVIRIITPGTITEEILLDKDSYNYLACIALENKKVSVSWVDISSGDFYVETLSMEEVNSLLYKIQPKEILISESTDKFFLAEDFKLITTSLSKERFETKNCLSVLNRIFADNSFSIDNLEKLEKLSCGVILYYLELTQKDSLNISLPKKDNSSTYVRIDSFTRNSLEILSSYSGSKQGSLKATIDYTKTSQGSRMLAQWISNPLKDVLEINNRLDVVSYFLENQDLLHKVRDILKNIQDAERALGRIMLKRATVLEISVLRSFLRNQLNIKQLFLAKKLPKLLKEILSSFYYQSNLLNTLNEAIVEDIGAHNRESGFLNTSYNAPFKEFLLQKEILLKEIILLQESYISKTSIPNLKIVYNNLDGYYIEVQLKYSTKIPNDNNFIHKRNTSTSVRYTTLELEKLSTEVDRVDKLILNLEKQIFNSIIEDIIKESDFLKKSSKSLAALDVLTSFSALSLNCNLTRPVVDDSSEFFIENGRHLVVEKSLQKKENNFFVPNSCCMKEKNIFLITGPNMAGKSTYLRQNALFIILAQSGCFVPALKAHIGVCDAIFSRVGASDDLFKGQSTFMVEMLELSIILNNATNKSFIILDEIGRGTSTYDGLSIAWATLEYINDKLQARTLFATHYHELVELEKKLNFVECYYVKVIDEKDKIVFMHSVVKGAFNKSYGIEVAKIAGIPSNVIKESQSILSKLEKKDKLDLPLFSFVEEPKQEVLETDSTYKVIEHLNSCEIDELSPKQALDFLYNLKDLLKNKE